MTFWDIYDSILKEDSKWNPNPHLKVECNLEKIFDYPHSYNFIFELFFGDCNFRSLAIELYKRSTDIMKERLKHTVSLYLLGIYVASKIGFEKFSINEWDKNSSRNFLHYWLAICLFHDIGYSIEMDKEKYDISKLETLDDFVKHLGLRFDLRNVCDEKLLNAYYSFRTKKMKSVDHGIVGAMLMYDSLMNREEKNADIAKTAIVISEKPICGNMLKEDFAECSFLIAKHNMWFANTFCKKIAYRKMGLQQLIGKTNSVMFEDSPMLFLLCLLDTIEPLKANNGNPRDILNKIELNCKSGSLIILDNDERHILKRAKGLKQWMGVNVLSLEKNKIEIRFNQRRENANKEIDRYL